MIHKDFRGRYTSSSSGTEAKVYAKSVELRYTDTGRTAQYTVHRFTPKSGIRWEAHIAPKTGDRFLGARTITFTKHQPIDWESGGRKEEETAVEWPDPRVGRLVMVEKYTDTDDTDDTTLIIFVLVVMVLCLILFNK